MRGASFDMVGLGHCHSKEEETPMEQFYFLGSILGFFVFVCFKFDQYLFHAGFCRVEEGNQLIE